MQGRWFYTWGITSLELFAYLRNVILSLFFRYYEKWSSKLAEFASRRYSGGSWFHKVNVWGVFIVFMLRQGPVRAASKS